MRHDREHGRILKVRIWIAMTGNEVKIPHHETSQLQEDGMSNHMHTCIDCGCTSSSSVVDEIKPVYRLEQVSFSCGAVQTHFYGARGRIGKFVQQGSCGEAGSHMMGSGRAGNAQKPAALAARSGIRE